MYLNINRVGHVRNTPNGNNTFARYVMVDKYVAFFNCTPVGRASDSMMDPTKLFILVAWGRRFLSVAWPTGVQLEFFFCSGLSESWRMFIMIYLFVLDDSLTS